MKNIDQNGNKKDEIGLSPELKSNPFAIPTDYFQTSKKDILQNIKAIKLAESAFSTPTDYQSQLKQDILIRISEEKLKSKIHKDGFSVPDNYFNALHQRITSETSDQTKVVPIRRFKTSWLSYGAAACLALAVSIFTITYQNQSNKESETNNLANELHNIDVLPTETIIDYLAFYPESNDIIILSDHLTEESDIYTDSFSSDEIESYLQNSI